jgi:hypothetical protein
VKQSATRIVVLLMALSTPGVAHAHLVNSGLGPFYDGALHLVLSPMDFVRLLTLSLFAGAQEPGAGRAVVVTAPVAWLLAGAAGLAFDAPGAFAVANGVSLFLLGAAVALNLRAPAVVAAVIAAGFGGLLGFQSSVELRADNADWVALVGASAVVLALLLLVTSFVASATAFALRVTCRVLGSWAAATGLLSIGWIIAANR